MKVSFVVPIYKKTPEQVKGALQSLKSQSHKDIEVICVFDGADPVLEPIVKLFTVDDQRFSVITIEHGGAPKARNAGAKLATGDVVSFWDADCYAEPEMVAMWLMTFKDNPDCDFVYSGYRWTDPKVQGYESELFDPWVLQKYNYIASMFPVKRSKMVEWDESLTGLQDWDYWRRIVENGSKGRFIPGFGFATDLPNSDSISGNTDKTKERISIIRQKHSDPAYDTMVYGGLYKREAIHIAKTIDADYFFNPFWRIRDYKSILMIGFHPMEIADVGSLFQKLSPDTIKIIYWMGMDSEMLYNAPYFQVKLLLRSIRDHVSKHVCDGERTRKILDDMGIQAEILPYPRPAGAISDKLPETLKILAVTDDNFKEHLKAIIKAVPYIEIDTVAHNVAYDIKDYTAAMQFTAYPRLLNESQKMLMQGRYLISNIQEPYAGYVDPSNVTKFKEEVIAKILALRDKTDLNKEAQDYYLQSCDPDKFRQAVNRMIAHKLVAI